MRTNCIDFADKEGGRGQHNPKILWTSFMEALFRIDGKNFRMRDGRERERERQDREANLLCSPPPSLQKRFCFVEQFFPGWTRFSHHRRNFLAVLFPPDVISEAVGGPRSQASFALSLSRSRTKRQTSKTSKKRR